MKAGTLLSEVCVIIAKSTFIGPKSVVLVRLWWLVLFSWFIHKQSPNKDIFSSHTSRYRDPWVHTIVITLCDATQLSLPTIQDVRCLSSSTDLTAKCFLQVSIRKCEEIAHVNELLEILEILLYKWKLAAPTQVDRQSLCVVWTGRSATESSRAAGSCRNSQRQPSGTWPLVIPCSIHSDSDIRGSLL